MKNINSFDEDPHPVLEVSENSGLQPLVEYFKKHSETITYIQHIKYCPEHSKYADLIRDMRGHSFSNMFRGWVGR